VEDSFTYAEEDVNARLLIETKTEAETVLNHVLRALKQADHLIQPDEKRRISQAIDALRAVEGGTDRDAIRERTIDLNKVTERLAEAMMEAALKGAVTSRRADEILEEK
jgi:molecular chaperone DnaK (HSP70)